MEIRNQNFGLQLHILKSRQGDGIKICMHCFNEALKLLIFSSTKPQVCPSENDLRLTSCPLFSIPKAPTANTFVAPASEQIIEMHQRRSV